MVPNLLHVFRNTPLGRETLLQSIYFCTAVDIGLDIYIPDALSFMMYFDDEAVQVDLDRSYLASPGNARERARALASQAGLNPRFLKPRHRTARDLPDVPTHFQRMSCPRSISDLSSKIGLGYIGPKVRRIIQSAPFPVLMASPVFKAWKSVLVLFGGSENACKALTTGLQIARRSGLPLDVFIQIEQDEFFYREQIHAAGLEKELSEQVRHWHQFEQGEFDHNLYTVPHDALVLSGAYGHGLIKQMFFGSKLETVQSTLTSNMLVSGPRSMASMAIH
jgi:nucleotide-binding universal stress UspA family protein